MKLVAWIMKAVVVVAFIGALSSFIVGALYVISSIALDFDVSPHDVLMRCFFAGGTGTILLLGPFVLVLNPSKEPQ